MNTIEAIKTRKSVRTYKRDAVEQEKISEIVKAGNMAAKAGKVFINVVTNPDTLKEWSETGRMVMQNSGNDFLMKASSNPAYSPIYNAPVAVIISAEKSDDAYFQSMAGANVACAAQNILLAATEFGLGSCYLVSATLALNVPELAEKVKLDSNLQPYAVVIFGYTDDTTPHANRSENPDNIVYA